MVRVGLHMIVKNEAHVIERALASLRPWVSWWVVCDTGSTDGTQELVRSAMAGIPGEVLEHAWVDFGHNRQLALEAARALPESRPDDYTIWLDADDEVLDVPDDLPPLTADGYLLPVLYHGLLYERVHLVRLDRDWRWQGVRHEVLYLDGAEPGRLSAPRVAVHHEGARSLDPSTYRTDAEALAEELRRNPGDPRTEFYLAQSWRDAGEPALAVEAYRVRVANPTGWVQEQWYARLQIGRCLERLDRDAEEVISAHLDAYAADASRAEPLVEAARLERLRSRHEVALLYARRATRMSPPDQGLFVDLSAYGWRAWDEVALNCYWAGHTDEGRAAALRAIELNPDEPRLQENLAWF